MGKICSKCRQEKELKDFAQRSDRKNKVRSYCKECDTLRRQKLYYKKHEIELKNAKKRHARNRRVNNDNSRNYHMKSRYGLTPEQYDELLLKQDNKCSVCLLDATSYVDKRFHIDHDHETGEIRGLLCSPCNRYFIGKQRTAEKFLRAIKYLEGPYTGLFVTEKDYE